MTTVPLHTLRIFVMVWGLLWGSFLNVVIYRLPREMSVVFPGSHCPGCGKPIRPYDNIPIVSFLLLRGRARCCGATMSPRYVIVEALGGGFSLAVFEILIRNDLGILSDRVLLLRFLAYFALVMILLAATFIDLEFMLLPEALTIGGTALGLVSVPVRDTTWTTALVGGAVGFFGMWLPFGVLYRMIRKRHGLGFGDAMLMMLAGVWFGWRGVLFALFPGAVQATLVTLVVYFVRGRIDEPEAVKREREELQRAAQAGDEEARALLEDDPIGKEPDEGLRYARVPFGPFLILGILEYLFFKWQIDEVVFGPVVQVFSRISGHE